MQHLASATPGPDGGTDRDARIEQRIAAERVATLYTLTPQPVLAGLVFAIVVGAAVWGPVPHALVIGWVLFKCGITAARVLDTRRYFADPARDDRVPYWTRRYIALMAVDALSWSAMVPLFAAGSEGFRLALLLGGVVGVASVGVFTTFGHLATSWTYLGCVLVPQGLWFATRPDPTAWAVAAGTLIYLGVLVFEARRSAQRLAETLRLRWQNAAIAEERARALVLAEHSSRAKSRFLAAVSHEMRTPLNGILGMTELMRGNLREAGLGDQLDIVNRSARHLNRVIGDLLDLSRIEFGRLVVEQLPYDPQATLREVTDLLAPVAAERGLALAVQVGGAVPAQVLGDAARVKQVLHNLVGNAIKYTERGTVEVLLRSSSDQRLEFAVRDSGPGIAPERHERIFDAFQQGDAATSGSGTGLGLTISRQLARAMGGDVTCESTPGLGSLFRFVLLAPRARVPTSFAAGPGPLPRLAGTALVVDDNEVNALVASGMLERLGMTVQTAADGAAALEALARGGIELVLMDMRMPRLDGLEATRRWRAAESGQRLPIIGVTANATEDDRRACLDAGMDDHLPKPFGIVELAEMVARHRMPAISSADAS